MTAASSASSNSRSKYPTLNWVDHAPPAMKVFDFQQILVLIQVANDIAAKLKHSFKTGDTVVFLGDSAGWIFEAWKWLGHRTTFKSKHLCISDTASLTYPGRQPPQLYLPLYNEKDPAKRVDLRDGLIKNNFRSVFPNGLSGTLWLVDHTEPRSHRESSVDGMRSLLQNYARTKGTADRTDYKLLRLMRLKNIGEELPGPCYVPVAYEIAVPDPANHKHSVAFETLLTGDSKRKFPRYCPSYGMAAWHRPVGQLWYDYHNPKTDFGRKYLAAVADVANAVSYYKKRAVFKQAVDWKKVQPVQELGAVRGPPTQRTSRFEPRPMIPRNFDISRQRQSLGTPNMPIARPYGGAAAPGTARPPAQTKRGSTSAPTSTGERKPQQETSKQVGIGASSKSGTSNSILGKFRDLTK